MQNPDLKYSQYVTAAVDELLRLTSQEKGTGFVLVVVGPLNNIELISSPHLSSTAQRIKNSLKLSDGRVLGEEPDIAPSVGLVLKPAYLDPGFQMVLDLSNNHQVNRHYTTCFTEIQQHQCKEIAKCWIRAIEPKKQTNFPYNGGNRRKPGWWPSKIDHIEPDHMNKHNRIQLLVSLIRNPTFSQQSLVNATSDSVIEKFSKPFAASILGEIQYVARSERVFLQTGNPNSQYLAVSNFAKRPSKSLKVFPTSMRNDENEKDRDFHGEKIQVNDSVNSLFLYPDTASGIFHSNEHHSDPYFNFMEYMEASGKDNPTPTAAFPFLLPGPCADGTDMDNDHIFADCLLPGVNFDVLVSPLALVVGSSNHLGGE
ncbi:hypothetical protein BABINDRAFT_89485 [Babjeviella inositovora NRRL Y-12698]|uniref:Subtelomeric hrmA-associated cluster protein AFUB-079030/YDR124W-like helical bundle domain-containing protein n=1 Tax=Babjeviella inositovora NRRL Y-12698 TaxID=984486 RepID=A0A1E3QMG1_9ASCO|nr:uncharacterized protein BABINDRAFT_89485 [Babjeviella inositovora NRRL Y-12698]ODQ78282.1 hypothetical protein BABINDRAFT_89485 [Babjeviella inositovora NRRL Y-12698]